MITHASELLALFIEEEKLKLQGIVMRHMPTLGSAYEEITKQGIDQEFVIPKFLDLHVVSGFVEIAGEMLPEQIDCMLVEGQGRQYGITRRLKESSWYASCAGAGLGGRRRGPAGEPLRSVSAAAAPSRQEGRGWRGGRCHDQTSITAAKTQ